MTIFKIIFMIVGLIFYGSLPIFFCKMMCSDHEKYNKELEINEDYKNF